jgi:hypothetical protein
VNADAIDTGFVARLADHAVLIELDGEAVLFDERTSAVHVLNPTATVIASCLDGTTDLAAVVGELAAAFSADTAAMQADVLDVARSLGRQGLLDGVEGTDPEEHEDLAGDELGSEPKFLADPPST